MKSIELTGTKRVVKGTAGAKNERNNNKVPAILYGSKENMTLSVEKIPFDKVIHSPNVYLINLDIEGTKKRAIIQDMRFHPVNDQVMHIDFLEVEEDKPLKVSLPIVIEGASPGVIKGGKLVTVSRKIKVKALAKDLPETIKVDISKLEIGNSVKIKDIVNNNLTFLNSPNDVVVAVRMSRAAMSASDTVVEAEETEEAAAE